MEVIEILIDNPIAKNDSENSWLSCGCFGSQIMKMM